MHYLAVIRPLDTARQSIELEESATPEHLLQPGRVGFSTLHPSRPSTRGFTAWRGRIFWGCIQSTLRRDTRADERSRLGVIRRPLGYRSGLKPACMKRRLSWIRSDATGQIQRTILHPLASRIASSRNFSSITTSATSRSFR